MTLKCRYDFGVGWEHTVDVEHVADKLPGLASPFLVDAVGRYPPENVWSFKSCRGPRDHERRGTDSDATTRQWIGRSFDPLEADLDRHFLASTRGQQNGAVRPLLKCRCSLKDSPSIRVGLAQMM
jgi:hypothetical protein